jgi:hypothetical protein
VARCCQAGLHHPHTKFKAQIYVLTKEEGGRHTPFFKGYRPQFYFRTTDVTGTVKLPDNVEMVMPGDNIAIEVELITPGRHGEGAPVRRARRRSHGGRGRRGRYHRITAPKGIPSPGCCSEPGDGGNKRLHPPGRSGTSRAPSFEETAL